MTVGLFAWFFVAIFPEMNVDHTEDVTVIKALALLIGGIVTYVFHIIGSNKIAKIKAYKTSLKKTRELFHAERFYNALSDYNFDIAINIVDNDIRTDIIANQLQGVILGFEIARTNGHEELIDVGMRIVKRMIQIA